MKRLSLKIILSIIGIAVIISVITALIGLFFIDETTESLVKVYSFPRAFGTAIIPLTILYFVVNRIMVKRVHKLNEATKLVAKGDYSLKIDENGKDELSVLAQNFNAMTSELNANEYLSKDFVRNISHEIKTPLSAINGFADLIKSESDKTEIDKYADIIISESERMLQMSKTLIELSRLDSTTIIKTDDNFCVASQIREIIATNQNSFEKKNLSFDVELDELKITSNEKMLYQVWENLISNAIKFSYEDSTILILLKQKEESVMFSIANSGIEIVEEERDKIFEHFYMSNPSKNLQGSGLGLSISKKIVDKLNGKIDFKSNSSHTEFYVELPISVEKLT